MKRIAILLLAVSLLWGCTPSPAANAPSTPIGATESTVTPADVNPSEMFTERDLSASFDSATNLALDGETLTLTQPGTYVLTGNIPEGSIIVDAGKNDKLQLVLSGVDIHSSQSAALYIKQADKVFITLAEGSQNTLSSGDSFVADGTVNVDAAVFSRADLTFNGSGSLTVRSPGGHGIVSKDDLVITGGTLEITASKHGLSGKDSVRLRDTAITVSAGKDGIHAENDEDEALGFCYIESGNYRIGAENDGISAGNVLQILGGSYNIATGGGAAAAPEHRQDHFGRPGQMGGNTTQATDTESRKAIKSASNLTLSGGDFVIDSYDDALHANGNLTISGGSYSIASGDDGVHADNTLTVSGGTINITKSYEGLEALHVLVSHGEITLTAADDGINAAGGNDESGFGGMGGDQFGRPGKPGGPGGGMPGGNANGSITIAGGKLLITASGDGIDANGSLLISGGYTVVCGPTQGDTATLDYDTSATITGGTFIGTGAAGMAQTFSESQQGVIAVRGSGAAGSTIKLTDSQGNSLIDYTPALPYNVVILSCPEIEKGATYTLTIGEYSGEIDAYWQKTPLDKRGVFCYYIFNI